MSVGFGITFIGLSTPRYIEQTPIEQYRFKDVFPTTGPLDYLRRNGGKSSSWKISKES
jgi:hypothetical protein